LRLASQNSTSTADETPLQTTKATLGDLVLYANGTGTIMPTEESVFGFNTSGQVSEIYVEIGDQVEAGDVLAQLDDTDAKSACRSTGSNGQLRSVSAIATAKTWLMSKDLCCEGTSNT
jgi:multidrug efflux pump subunit AcrA (membrane-fusion protein)